MTRKKSRKSWVTKAKSTKNKDKETTVLLMKSEAACGRCPLNLLCMTLRPMDNVTFCRRCGAIAFKRNGERYLCMLIREGIHSRIRREQFDTQFQQWDQMSNRQQRIAYVMNAVVNKNAEYEGCIRFMAKMPRQMGRPPYRHHKKLKRQYRYRDCVHYFEELGNGFDRVF
jgi:molybdenum cofactor biosynthesis enzyme MoaA